MYTVYKLNTDELSDNFVSSIKNLFPHKAVEIIVQDINNGQRWKALLGAMPDLSIDEDFSRLSDYGRESAWDS